MRCLDPVCSPIELAKNRRRFRVMSSGTPACLSVFATMLLHNDREHLAADHPSHQTLLQGGLCRSSLCSTAASFVLRRFLKRMRRSVTFLLCA